MSTYDDHQFSVPSLLSIIDAPHNCRAIWEFLQITGVWLVLEVWGEEIRNICILTLLTFHIMSQLFFGTGDVIKRVKTGHTQSWMASWWKNKPNKAQVCCLFSLVPNKQKAYSSATETTAPSIFKPLHLHCTPVSDAFRLNNSIFIEMLILSLSLLFKENNQMVQSYKTVNPQTRKIVTKQFLPSIPYPDEWPETESLCGHVITKSSADSLCFEEL